MSLLTLRVSKRDERTLVYVLLSLDPNERVETSEIEHTLPDAFQAVLSIALTDVEQCLRVGSKARLEKVGSDLARDVLPDDVKTALMESKDSYLYLDLEDALVSFPWECIRIGDSFIGTKFKAGRHIRVTDEGRAYKSLSDKQRCAIIANPDGSLKDAAKEGDLLADQLKTLGDVDLLKTNVTVNEACEVIASKDVFHFAGHSSGTGLRFSDRDMTAGDIASLPSVPRMVFLNSCDSGSLNAWANVDHSVVRAFLQAGSRAVIAAASPVATEQAAETARRFYERFLQKETLGQSLTAASTHATDELAWARYVVFGHPEFKLTRDEAPSTKKISTRALLAASLAACAMLAVVGAFSFKILSHRTPGLTDEERVSEEACLQGNSSECSTLGESLLKRGQAKDAISYLEKACQLGLTGACVSLAEGHLLAGDLEIAKKLVHKHCIEGHEFCSNVAATLQDRSLYDLALMIYSKRCEAGDSLGCVGASFVNDKKGDVKGAIEMSSKACDLGYSRGCHLRGVFLTKAGDFKAAFATLQKNCTPKSNYKSCTYLGVLFASRGQFDQAITSFKKGCQKSLRNAAKDCETAGTELQDARPIIAQEFFKQSCDLGQASACARIASLSAIKEHPCRDLRSNDCYQLGYRFQKSGELSQAQKIYSYLCQGGSIEQCNDVGVIHQLKGDLSAARTAFRDACAKKVALSCYNLGNMIEAEGSIADALKVFTEGCNLNNGQSCSQLGALLKKSTDTTTAETYLDKGCKLDDSTGCNNLGFYKNARNDKEGAKQDYKKACDLGLSLGCRNLALLLKELGGEQEAKAILNLSCGKGDVLACDLLKSEGLVH